MVNFMNLCEQNENNKIVDIYKRYSSNVIANHLKSAINFKSSECYTRRQTRDTQMLVITNIVYYKKNKLLTINKY